MGKRKQTRKRAVAPGGLAVAKRVDQVVQEVERSIDTLQERLENLRGVVPDLVAVEARRERLRLIQTLAEDGILDSLQRLAKVMEDDSPGGLPEALNPLRDSPRMILNQLCRAFQVQTVYQRGERITVMEVQHKDFDWSSDRSAELTFPVQVEVLRSGWKTRDGILVLPKVRVRESSTAIRGEVTEIPQTAQDSQGAGQSEALSQKVEERKSSKKR